MHLHGGPLASHLPDQLHSALSLVTKQHLMQKGLEHIFPEVPPTFTFGGGNDLRLDEEDEDAFYQQESTANGTGLEELNTRVVTVEVEDVV